MSVAFGGLSRADAFRQRSRRRITVVISVLVHAAAGIAAIAYSFWHVEEISPPTVTVTFVSAAAAPPPPPPPPPLGGGAAPKHPRVARPKTATPTQPEQPKPVETPVKAPVVETPKAAPTEAPAKAPEGDGSGSGRGAGSKNGVAGGVPGGVANGVVGGAVGAPPTMKPKFLPPAMGAQLKLSGADPDFPPRLATPGARYLVVAKICVSVAGAVDSVTIQKHAEPTLDGNVVTTVKTWRFRPETVNGMPVPFCTFKNFEFKSD